MINFLIMAAFTVFTNAAITTVHDGDTFFIDIPSEPALFGDHLGVRIKGIDAPEIHAKRACERRDALTAKNAMEALVVGHQVDLNFCSRDKFFRALCSVRVDQKIDAADYMISQGLAVPYFGQTKKTWKCKS